MGFPDHLFTPFTLGGVELPNIVMLPMTTGMPSATNPLATV